MKAGTRLDGGMYIGKEMHSYLSLASLLQHTLLPWHQPPTGPEPSPMYQTLCEPQQMLALLNCFPQAQVTGRNTHTHLSESLFS